jgi:hypothetical protein
MVGFIDSLFGGGNGSKYINQGYKASNKGYETGLGIQEDARDDALNQIKDGASKGIGYLDQGLTAGLKPLQTQLDQGNSGIANYNTLMGLDGADGSSAFYDSPYYSIAEQGREAGLEGIGRMRAGAGSLFSGNAMIDAMEYGQKYDTGLYKDLLGFHDPYFQMANNAASGISNAHLNTGANKAEVAVGRGKDMADIYTNSGNRLSQMQVDKGRNKANMFADKSNLEQAKTAQWMDLLKGGLGLAGTIVGKI